MDIVLMRHGRAADRDRFRGDDELRPLTNDGRARLRKSLPGLLKVVPHIDRVVTSPLLRAKQTAEVVLERFAAPLSELAALSPGGDLQAAHRWLVRHKDGVVLLVGHEPDLGRLASWYLAGSDESFLPLKKGAICMIHFNDKPAMAKGELTLLLTAAQLRQNSCAK